MGVGITLKLCVCTVSVFSFSKVLDPAEVDSCEMAGLSFKEETYGLQTKRMGGFGGHMFDGRWLPGPHNVTVKSLDLHLAGPQPGHPLEMSSAPQYTQSHKAGALEDSQVLSEIRSFDFRGGELYRKL